MQNLQNIELHILKKYKQTMMALLLWHVQNRDLIRILK